MWEVENQVSLPYNSKYAKQCNLCSGTGSIYTHHQICVRCGGYGSIPLTCDNTKEITEEEKKRVTANEK